MSTEAPAAPSKLWWMVPAAAFLLLVTLAALVGGPAVPPEGRTSFDAGDDGFRATYLLLDQLDFPVSRSRRPAGGPVRWVLFPDEKAVDVAALDSWVRGGGLLLLADPSPALAGGLGVTVRTRTVSDVAGPLEVTGVDGVSAIAPGPAVVEPDRPGPTAWGRAGGAPVVSVVPRGRGEVWLVHRPELFSNQNLRKHDNAVLVCRLAEATLARRPGGIAFDEFAHGLRDRPGVVGLLFRPPMLWASLAGLLVTALALWRFVPRFGPEPTDAPPRRRSKEEYLDALAALLERKRAFADGFETARRDALRRIAAELGLPGSATPDQVVAEARQRRRMPAELDRLLHEPATSAGRDARSFVAHLNQLEAACDELRQPRRRAR
jgi:hypothetical protein